MERTSIGSVLNIARRIMAGLDRPQNLKSVLEVLNSEFGAKSSFILLQPVDSDRLRAVASANLNIAQFRALETRADSEFWRENIQSDAEVQIFDPANEPSLDMIESSGNELLATVKILLLKRVIGFLCVTLEKEQIGIGYDTVSALKVIASMIAQNIRVEMSVVGERERLREENLQLKNELKEKYEFSHIIGRSNEMRQVYEQITQVARSNATVLLRGESGTGKEMIANAIHYNSLRSKRPLIKVNCAALPESLIESELFGHEKGAFTGADRFKKGRFEQADGGTLFLDEIGDLPLQTQIKLLRVLQEREFERLGGTDTVRTNIRLMTATNKNLEKAIEKGEFREDLYYRLNVFTIFLPPLRERKSDILLLAEHFLEKYENEHGKRIRRISTPAIDMLMSYHFPGNVRELENAIERAVLVCDSNVIHGHHLPPSLQTAEVSDTETRLTLSSAVSAFEKDLIQDTLKSTRGNIAKAAKQLGSTERILGYKVRKYSIDTTRYRK